MPRASKEAKAESRARILAAAARLFRERGIEATGLGEVMTAAGLTHGGFYRHFASKEALVAAAIDAAVEGIAAPLAAQIAAEGARPAVCAYVERYLSQAHVAHPEAGCPIAALATEAGQDAPAIRDAMAKATARIVELIASALDDTDRPARQKAAGVMATLVGTVILARSTTSDAMRQVILEGGWRQVAPLLSD